jgi:hypothetical protein
MNNSANWTGAGMLLLGAALTLSCGSRGPDLSGAVYRDQIPIYSPASLTEVMGGSTSDLEGGNVSHSASWWLDTPHSRAKVEAWYDQQIPNAQKSREDWGDGPVTVYKWAPKGGKPGEELTITITDDDIQITETIQGPRKGW